MCPINLQELFDSTCQTEYTEHYNCIYMIRNLLNDHKYIGQAKDFYIRFMCNSYFGHKYSYEDYVDAKCTNIHLYNALRKYSPSNFEVSIIEENLLDKGALNDREIYWIAFYHTFSKDPKYSGGYNMTSGGDNCEAFIDAGHKALKLKYPEYNGANPNWIKAGLEAAWAANKEKYPDTNGMPIEAIEAANKAMKEKYPDTNGAPPAFWEAGNATMKEKYPDTNGAPPQWMKAGLTTRANKYGMNGMTPQCIEAALEVNKKNYPDTNGMPPQAIEAGRKARMELYPNTNGAPDNWIKAGNESSRDAKIRRGYDAVVEMCINLRDDGYSKWTLRRYRNYQISGAPGAQVKYILRFFRNCIEKSLDISKFIDTFPDEWIPEEYK